MEAEGRVASWARFVVERAETIGDVRRYLALGGPLTP
jgi:hypothetical protein